MSRREFIMLFGSAALAWPLAARAQQPAKVPRVGILWAASPSVESVEEFRQGLRELGYVEGQNIILEHRSAQGKLEQFAELAAELVRLKVDVIMVESGPAAVAARQATTTIPIVMVSGGDVTSAGFVPSLAQPGGNVTGLTAMIAETSAKRLELLKELVPGLTRVAVLWNAANPFKVHDWKETEAAARVLKLSVQSQEVRSPDDFQRAFAAITQEHPGALILLGDPLIASQRERIIEFAAKSRLPAMYPTKHFVQAGGLIAYGADTRKSFWRRAATYTDKILKGARPSDLPIEQPTKFELVINLKTASTLGLTIPPTVLARADEVIE